MKPNMLKTSTADAQQLELGSEIRMIKKDAFANSAWSRSSQEEWVRSNKMKVSSLYDNLFQSELFICSTKK